MTYINPIIQVLFLVGVGWILARASLVKQHIPMLSSLIMYVLVPAVVFRSVYQSPMQPEDCLLFYFSLFSVYLCTLLLSFLLGKLFGFRGTALRMVCICSPYSNNGAAGYTIIHAFLGEAYSSIAAVSSAFGNVLINLTAPLLVKVKQETSLLQTLRELLRMPVLYALLLGFLLKGLGVELPSLLMTPIDQLASAAFPLCLLLIGIQMQGQRIRGDCFSMLLPACIKLLLMPLIAAFLVKCVLPLPEKYDLVVFLLAAMPPAATMVAIVSNCGMVSEADAVASATCFTTIISLLTIPLMLYLSSVLF